MEKKEDMQLMLEERYSTFKSVSYIGKKYGFDFEMTRLLGDWFSNGSSIDTFEPGSDISVKKKLIKFPLDILERICFYVHAHYQDLRSKYPFVMSYGEHDKSLINPFYKNDEYVVEVLKNYFPLEIKIKLLNLNTNEVDCFQHSKKVIEELQENNIMPFNCRFETRINHNKKEEYILVIAAPLQQNKPQYINFTMTLFPFDKKLFINLSRENFDYANSNLKCII